VLLASALGLSRSIPVSLASALWYLTTALEMAVIVIALRRRIPRLLPYFFAYLIWTVASDAVGYAAKANHNPYLYDRVFLYETSLNALMQFGVLVELAWSVLRPMRSMLPRRTILWISLGVLGAGAAVWPITTYTVNHTWWATWVVLLRVQQTFSLLMIVFFLGLAALSQFLAIGWRDRELQVATGLGFYSVITMGAALLHTHPGSVGQFDIIEDFVALSYVCSLIYWGYSFLQKEAPRQEFSPRMQSILLTVSGAARTNRLAMEEMRKNSTR
jgi:hypothetical protein